MMNTAEIMQEAESLPVEERVMLVDSLLRSLNQPGDEIDRQWAQVALRRRDELRSGQVAWISGEVVLARLRS